MKSLLLFLLVIFSLQWIASGWTFPQIETWYATLQKPAWNPPSWLFGPVWSVLYVLIAVSGWMIWKRRHEPGANRALWIYTVQMLLNVAWTPVFFGLHQIGLSVAVISVLMLFIMETVRLFWPIHGTAAWLLFPYMVWVSFAVLLNFTIWKLNS